MVDSTNGMPNFMGRGVGLSADQMITNMAWVPLVVAKTADYTVKTEESGTFFTTEGTTGGVNFTLPAASDKWWFKFFCAEDFEIMVTAETADTMITFNDVDADNAAFTTSSEHIGSGFECFSAGGSVVYVIPLGIGGHIQTLTITD